MANTARIVHPKCKTLIPPGCYHQFLTSWQNVYGEWEEHIHPSGATYYYNQIWKTYIGLNLRDCSKVQLENFEVLWMALIFEESAILLGNGIIKAQFWKHVEFFPYSFKLDRFLVRKLQAEIDWFHADALTLENSTLATIFSNRDVTEKIITRLASLGSDGSITEPGVALFCRLYHMLQHLNQIYVDGLVNSLNIKNFVDDVSTQITVQITLAGVIMAINASFLAIQGVGTGKVAESILKGSIIFCVACMFLGMFAQHFGEKLKTLRFAAYYLDQEMIVVIGVLSAPRFFYIMRQMYLGITWSSIGFLASAFVDSEHSTATLVTCTCCLLIVMDILGPLAWCGLRAGVVPFFHIAED
ncbi:uncharacterized protein HD556DRAFT_1310550 [Suillus plorans]|uniref:Uncharacterized protein n=1 Tax=Suillus plorans TaxID=116603 RepID=A0A9P7AJ12_9AGAM|nr:uncharacterized protein HD556DRAFT_1310550 [Suillus plorans]KAG1790536.1 hypothetical protein HD556DRAFT_1310550 [Suillus plorans]